MSIDFTRISTGDDFELLCRDVLKSKGINILANPAVGPDQGKDILVEVESKDELGTKEKLKYVVQCKHYAKSGKSVQESNLGDFRSICDKHNANGYFLITSTMPYVNVSSSFEGVNNKGDYKCLFWDKKQLEIEIENLDDSVEIIKRYNLKSDFDNISSFVNRILDSESKLPLEFSHTISEEKIGGHIYKKLISDIPTPKYDLIGYFWTDHIIDKIDFDKIKSQYSLSELYIVTTDNNKSDFSMSLNEFYMHIQSYKDIWYQLAIVKLVGFSPINPTVIHLINSIVTPLAYPIQKPFVNLLSDILKIVPSTTKKFDVFVVREACNAIAKQNIQDLKQNVFDLLSLIPIMRKRFIDDKNTLMHIDTLTDTIVSSLIDLESKKLEFDQKIIELYSAIDDIDYKMDLLPYLKKYDIHCFDDELHKIKETQGKHSLNPPYNAISYSPKGVSIIKNEAPCTIARVIDDYFDIKDTNDGLIIQYTKI